MKFEIQARKNPRFGPEYVFLAPDRNYHYRFFSKKSLLVDLDGVKLVESIEGGKWWQRLIGLIGDVTFEDLVNKDVMVLRSEHINQLTIKTKESNAPIRMRYEGSKQYYESDYFKLMLEYPDVITLIIYNGAFERLICAIVARILVYLDSMTESY